MDGVDEEPAVDEPENIAGQESKDLPVVFQCQQCNTILSDSLAFVAANDDLKAITLDRVTSSVELSSKLVTSTDGIDQGSTYTPLICNGCQSVVGKSYKTTPRVLDDLRDAFTLSVDSVSMYQVGSADTAAMTASDNFVESSTSLKSLKETTLKLQVLVCAMHQRIANIEQCLEIEDQEEAGTLGLSMAGLVGSTPMREGTHTTNGQSESRGEFTSNKMADSQRSRSPTSKKRAANIQTHHIPNKLVAESLESSNETNPSSSGEAESRKRKTNNERLSREGRTTKNGTPPSRSRKRGIGGSDDAVSKQGAPQAGLGTVSPIKKRPNSKLSRP
ncbi:uncharacterized protein [Diadema antillarum]|uniref:uncharacterized protein n=1 Tax=Diadema antillarum TaxID=105358 RepID=UPI003A853545